MNKDSEAVATEIVRKLTKAGHVAYFAGGWVRDHLMGHPSYDIDIATDASPDKILDLFPRTILVGLSFGIVVVLIGEHQFEVASFRRDLHYLDGRRPETIEFSTPEEDAKRRDFTINGMFYDPLLSVVHDFVGGAQDIQHQMIRAIGDPYERFREDRLRMIRAVRFAARFGFQIESETLEAIKANASDLLPAVAMERVWQELNKMAAGPHFDQALVELHRLGLLQEIFPDLRSVGLEQIRKRVAHLSRFPQGAPAIFFLLELFPDLPLDSLVEIFKGLKVPNRDIKLAELITLGRGLIQNIEAVDMREWVYFFAHPDSQMCIEAIAAREAPEEGELLLHLLMQKQESLSTHIQRVQLGKPLVTAALLQAHGVSPGKPMGLLLKEAERMVINHNRDNAEGIIDLLKQGPHWPQTAFKDQN
jgi:poly(A) polymerase